MKWSWPNLRKVPACPDISLKGLKEAAKYCSQLTRSPGPTFEQTEPWHFRIQNSKNIHSIATSDLGMFPVVRCLY